MNLDEFLGNSNNVPCRVHWFLPSGIPFLSRNIFAPYCMYNVDILDHHRKVYDLLDLSDLPEIFNWWITKFGVQNFCLICT